MVENVQIDNAQVRFLNFEGRPGMYNNAGERNFCIFLDPERAELMARQGWNIKTLKARTSDDIEQDYIEVAVKFQGRNGPVRRPPRIVMITSRGRTDLDEETCHLVDVSEIKNVDLIIRANEYDFNGRQGVKAYLKSFFMTLDEDVLEQRYAHVPVIGAAPEQPAISSRQQAEIASRPHYDFEGEVV